MKAARKKKNAGFAAGGKIGAVAKRAWVCTACGHWHDIVPWRASAAGASGRKRLCDICGNPVQHFHSRAEARRYKELVLLQNAGEIQMLKCQPLFELAINGVRLGMYFADFCYFPTPWYPEQKWVYEDVKGGAITEISDLKRRLAEAIHGVKINVVRMK